MKGHQLTLSKDKTGVSMLKTVAGHGSFDMARDILKRVKKRARVERKCFLCEGKLENIDMLADKAVRKLKN